MTAQIKTTLKGNFETGDAPDGSNYADLIDSFLGLVETSGQVVTGPVSFTGAVSLLNASAQTLTVDEFTASAATVTHISAGTGLFTGIVSAATVNADTLIVAGTPVAGAGARARANVYIAATASTVVAVQGTFYDVEADDFSAKASYLVDFSALSTGRAKYKGSVAKTFLVNAAFSVEHVTNSHVLSFQIAVSGSGQAGSVIDRKMGTAGDIGAGSVQSVVSAGVSAEIGVQLANKSGTTNPTVKNMSLAVTEA